MSRIYEALKSAQDIRLKTGASDRDRLGGLDMPDRRRSKRWGLDVPLTVYGRASSGSPFYQKAEAVSGNANGGLIVLGAPVQEGQDLLLINNYSPQEQLCRVVHVRSRDAETSEVGVVFPSPHLEFWKIPTAPRASDETPSDESS
jgi:hypothetical protein